MYHLKGRSLNLTSGTTIRGTSQWHHITILLNGDLFPFFLPPCFSPLLPSCPLEQSSEEPAGQSCTSQRSFRNTPGSGWPTEVVGGDSTSLWVGSGGLRNKAFQSSHTSLLGMQNGRAIWEGSLVVSFKKKKKFFFVCVCQVLVGACRILSFSMQTLHCRMWDLVPWPQMEPRPPALGTQSLTHWSIREVPGSFFFILSIYLANDPAISLKQTSVHTQKKHVHVYLNFLKLKTTQISIRWWRGKQIVIHCYNQPLLSDEMYELLIQTSAQKNVKNYAKWKGPNRKILQGSSFAAWGRWELLCQWHGARGTEKRWGAGWAPPWVLAAPWESGGPAYCIRSSTFCSFSYLQIRTY